MSAADNFRSQFDAEGRFRARNGSVDVVFLTNTGQKYPGRLAFKDGLCVSADMEGSSRWAYPDGSPLSGLRLLLHFEQEEPLVILIHQGRVVTPDAFQGDNRSVEDVVRTVGAGIRIDQRAHTTMLSLSRQEQIAVLDAVVSLARQTPAEWPLDSAFRLAVDEPLYLIRVASDLRAFIRVTEDGQIELFDIVRDATLQTFLDRSRAKSGVK